MLTLLATFAFAGDPVTAPVGPPATPAAPAVDPCVVVPATPTTPAADANVVPATPTPPAPPVVGATPPANCPTAAPAEPKRKGLKKSNDNRMEAESTDE